jgi:hypothetical protein
MKYWVSVVSKEHALRGIGGGYMQACHGKEAPLNRMKPGDFFMFYCPNAIMLSKEKIQKFIGLGKVKDKPTYQFSMSDSFHPYRRDIEFIPGAEKIESAVISELKDLSIKSKFRFGFFELPEEDFNVIAQSMGI